MRPRENPATNIWLWGQGTTPKLESLEDKFGLRGAAIAAVDLIRGFAKTIGMDVLDVEGATGYIDTNYRGKGEAAVKALDDYDIVAVHIEAPDEAGHNGDARAKIQAIERIDEFIVGPVVEKLKPSTNGRFSSRRITRPPSISEPTRPSRPPSASPEPGSTQSLARPFNEKAAAEAISRSTPATC